MRACRKHLLLALVLSLASICVDGLAAERPESRDEKTQTKDEGGGDKASEDKKKPEGKESEKEVETRNTVTIGGQKIAYTAVAGTILLRDAEEKPTASIFYIAYTRDDATNRAARPITFAFNGGPGSSSVWLHMGLLGPRRVALAEDGGALPPPYGLVDNEYTLLDETDLVFIDPVSTGYSRPIKPDDAAKFHGVREDVASVGEFIRIYVTRHQRWLSPKFIIGESYGTTRAAALSGELAERHRMNVNGILLVSSVLNFQTLNFAEGNDLPYILYLPSYTAVAWYHHKLPADLQALGLEDVLGRAEAFASGPYQAGLFQGATLPSDERRGLVRTMASLTGLPEDYVDRSDLRVPLGRFARELLAGENRVVGRYDGRYTGLIRDRIQESMEYDPSAEAVFSAFASTFNDYVRRELNYKTDLPYEILRGVRWNWGESNSYVNVADTLADSITRNPFLKIHVSAGYYDLATPYFAARYTFNHLRTDSSLGRNITLDTYTSGHMTYLNRADLRKQKADMAAFILAASHQAPPP